MSLEGGFTMDSTELLIDGLRKEIRFRPTRLWVVWMLVILSAGSVAAWGVKSLL